MSKIYVLNTLIVPIDFDKHRYIYVKFSKTTVEDVRQILQNNEFISAVGHEGTAKLLSQLLGIPIPTNRITIFLEKGDMGIHFFLKRRIEEGKVLSEEELKTLDFWLIRSEVL
jgi:hypothetical protein